MARATAKRENKPLPAKAKGIPLLQERLLLNRYLCNQLGFEHFRQMRDALKDIKEGWDAGGHSHFYWRLVGQQGLKVPPDKLATYDLRIKDYVDQLNRTGERQVQLKYFQYLAALFTEIYLDDLFNSGPSFEESRESFLEKLNRFVEEENRKLPEGAPPYELFTEADLDKLAFWMATGSGKTLVMHINLWQYQHYSQGNVNNVLLITPNEGLSEQHKRELEKSGIPAIRHGEAGSLNQGTGLVRVIEITKLTKTKRGGGLSVEVDAFGPNNLLLVDEGHRGASGEVWWELRKHLAEKGFTFEYSATFGQIVNGASKDKRPALLEEYSKAILFDYSYPHFYEDGYGKDYWILNLKDETDSLSDWLLLGNLLSFYEQLLLYEEGRESFRPYNLEKPLWVFVGNTVIGRKAKGDEREPSDVEEIVLFFDRFLRKPKHWIDRIGQVLAGQTGLKKRSEGEGEKDIFADLFPYLKEKRLTAEAIYEDVVRRVFGGQRGDRLRAVALKTASGEIGLRAGADRPYFGVINIGDVSGLMKLLQAGGIACEEENITGSLFSRINEPDSPVNVLIGSRKFMEGWDSFRVSSMGLMNIGKGEGAQIIQLFGRGVRLWGKGLSLKRSSALGDSGAPPHIRLLETLNVFGVRANYMAQFREYLKQEGIEAEFEEIPLPIVVQKEFLESELQVLRLPEGERFEDRKGVVLEVDGKVKVTLDLRSRFELAESREKKEEAEKVGGEDRAEALRQSAHLFDWRRIYFELLAFKRLRGFHNLSFGEADLREIIERGKYEVFCPNGGLPPSSYREIRRAEDIAIAVLQKYVATFYDRRRREWEREHIRLVELTEDDPNLKFGGYTLRVHRELADRLRELIEDADEIYKKDATDFPNIHFDRHLYQPLLVADEEGRIKSNPPGLNRGEAKFVRDLRSYLQAHKEKFEGKEVFLLRNLTRGKGIGFFEGEGGEAFYPDFILWVIGGGKQWIAFIDPHGLRFAEGGFSDPKIQLHKTLRDLEEELRRESQKEVHLTSFIIAPSSYEKTKRHFGGGGHSEEEFEQNHVLFIEDEGYICKLFKKMLGSGDGES